MPATRYGWVCRALKSSKAKPVTTVPFTIQLTYAPGTHKTQSVTLGIDPERTNIGLAAASDTGKCLLCRRKEKHTGRQIEKYKRSGAAGYWLPTREKRYQAVVSAFGHGKSTARCDMGQGLIDSILQEYGEIVTYTYSV